MRRWIRRNYIAAAAVLLILCLFAFSQFGKTKTIDVDQPIAIRILFSPSTSVNNAMVVILKEKMFFEEELPENVTVEWISLDSTSARRDAITAGKGDITMVNMPSFIAAKEAMLPIGLLSNVTISGAAYYSVNDRGFPLESIGANDKLAITGSIGNTAHLSFQIACMEMFGNSSIFDQNVLALVEGDVVAMVSNTNDLAGVIANDRIVGWPQNMKMVIDLTPYIQKYGVSGVFAASTTFMTENPAMIDAFYRAERAAVQFIKENPDEAAAILASFWEGENAEDMKKALVLFPPEIEISESGYDLLASFMYQSGLIDNEPIKFRDFSNYDALPKKE